jgi:hypothetical protein
MRSLRSSILLFVIPKFVSLGDLVSELKQRVMQCKKRRFVFQGARHNDNRRIQASIQDLRGEGIERRAVESVAAKLRTTLPNRPVHEITVLVSLKECGSQRPHADHTRESLEGIGEDGMPLGVVSVLLLRAEHAI